MNVSLAKTNTLSKLALKVLPFIVLNTVALLGLQTLFARRMSITTYGIFNLWLAGITLLAILSSYVFNNLANLFHQNKQFILSGDLCLSLILLSLSH